MGRARVAKIPAHLAVGQNGCTMTPGRAVLLRSADAMLRHMHHAAPGRRRGGAARRPRRRQAEHLGHPRVRGGLGKFHPIVYRCGDWLRHRPDRLARQPGAQLPDHVDPAAAGHAAPHQRRRSGAGQRAVDFSRSGRQVRIAAARTRKVSGGDDRAKSVRYRYTHVIEIGTPPSPRLEILAKGAETPHDPVSGEHVDITVGSSIKAYSADPEFDAPHWFRPR